MNTEPQTLREFADALAEMTGGSVVRFQPRVVAEVAFEDGRAPIKLYGPEMTRKWQSECRKTLRLYAQVEATAPDVVSNGIPRAAHTPGPWSYGNGIVVGDGKIVCDYGCTMERNHDSEANARLISAAPELLNALEMAIATVQRYAQLGGFTTHGATIQLAEAAIAKAKGVQP